MVQLNSGMFDCYVGHMPEYLCEEQDRVVGVRSFFISKNKLRRCLHLLSVSVFQLRSEMSWSIQYSSTSNESSRFDMFLVHYFC